MIPDAATSFLAKRKIKKTKSRLAIVRLLMKAKAPLTADAIYNRNTGSFDRATVYRTLSSFADMGLVRKIELQKGAFFYEIEEVSTHHHHVVCRKCDRVEDIAFDEKSLVRSVIKQSKQFGVLDGHAIEFFGICKTCSE